MDDRMAMRVFQCGADLLSDLHRFRDRQPVLLGTGEQPFQVAARHVLADNIRLPVVIANVEHRDDVRLVSQPAHRLRLALDAL